MHAHTHTHTHTCIYTHHDQPQRGSALNVEWKRSTWRRRASGTCGPARYWPAVASVHHVSICLLYIGLGTPTCACPEYVISLIASTVQGAGGGAAGGNSIAHRNGNLNGYTPHCPQSCWSSTLHALRGTQQSVAGKVRQHFVGPQLSEASRDTQAERSVGVGVCTIQLWLCSATIPYLVFQPGRRKSPAGLSWRQLTGTHTNCSTTHM